MALFEKALKTAKNIGNSMANTAVNAGSTAGVAVQEQTELAGLKMQVNVIEEAIDFVIRFHPIIPKEYEL